MQFQVANNTAVMTDVGQDQSGVISGMLNLSRDLGLITGASVMGVVHVASGAIDMRAPHADAVSTRVTFATAAVLVIVAAAISVGSRARAERPAL
jgi:hypothetical protein